MGSVQLIAQTPDMTAVQVTFISGQRAFTTITNAAYMVVGWLSNVVDTYAPPAGANARQVVGLHIEVSPPYGPIDLLQLCVGNSCLIYQLRHRSDDGPFVRLLDPFARLHGFFNDDRFCFTGVGVQLAMDALHREYGFRARVAVDLKDVAARRLQRNDLRWAGLDQLAREVLGIELIRPNGAQRSALLERVLPLELIPFACVDAIFSYELGRILLA